MIAKEKSYDYEYYMSLPEGSRVELIDGQIYNMAAAPNTIHQEISGFIYRKFGNYLDGKKCKVYAAPFDVFLKKEKSSMKKCKNIVQPDISIICDKKKITKQGCVGAPDFIAEIVSPSNMTMDYVKKLFLYFEYGVKEYWIVDPIKQNVHVYILKDDIFDLEIYSFLDKITVDIFSDLEIDFSEIDLDFI